MQRPGCGCAERNASRAPRRRAAEFGRNSAPKHEQALQPLSTKKNENATPVEKREELAETGTVRAGKDKVEMAENARLLAKARATLGDTESADAERLALLKQQVESGDYTIQVGDLARKLLAKLFPK